MKSPLAEDTCAQCGATVGRQEATCSACGAHLSWAEGVWIQPLFERAWEGGPPRQAAAGAPPASSPAPPRGAELRSTRILVALARTAVAFALRSEAAFRHFRQHGGFRGPLAYIFFLGVPSLLLAALTRKSLLREHALEGTLLFALLGVLPFVYVFVRAHMLHLTLVLTDKAAATFEVTFRLTSYAQASLAPLLIVPLVGEFLFLTVGALVEANGLRACHRLGVVQACVVEILPASACLLVLLATLFLGILWWSQF